MAELNFDITNQTLVFETGSTGPQGVQGDGFTLYSSFEGSNFTEKLQAAIDSLNASGGGRVFVPAGSYALAEPISMKSNVAVECEHGVTINANGFADADAIEFFGTAGSEFNLSVSAGRGDTTITVSGSPGFTVGQIVHLWSCRNALSTDAGEYRLGDGTVSLNYAYFSEFNMIAEDLGSGEYRLAFPIVHAAYPATDAAETDSQRTNSTVRAITPCENAHWIGGTIIRDTAGADVFDSLWAKDCTVQNCTVDKGSRNGGAFRWVSSWNCEFTKCHSKNDETYEFVYADDHGEDNRFKIIGSHDCGLYRCSSTHAAQTVDFVYGVVEFTNIRPYCDEGHFVRSFEGLTSHQGCYQERWRDNVIVDCFNDGITCRSPEAIIVGNVISGPNDHTADIATADEHVGIELIHGFSHRGQISGNRISNFYAAFGVTDSGTGEQQFSELATVIEGNYVHNCQIGLETYFVTGSPYSGLRNLIYKNNSHSNMGRYLAYLGQYSAGTSIVGNSLAGDFEYAGVGSSVALAYASANCPAITVRENEWRRTKGGNSGKTIYDIVISALSDTTTYPEADFAGKTVVLENHISYRADDGVTQLISATGYNQLCYWPWPDGKQEVTLSSNVGVFVPDAGNSTSLSLDTEGGASSDFLDKLEPAAGCSIRSGHIVTLSTESNSRDVTIRDDGASGVAEWGIREPSNTNRTLNTSPDAAVLVYTGYAWVLIAFADV